MMGRVARNSEAGAGERGVSAPQVGGYNSDGTDVHDVDGRGQMC